MQDELKKSNRFEDDHDNTCTILSTRLERLLKERELRKSLKSYNVDVRSNGGIENNVVDNQISTSTSDKLPTEEELANGIRINKIVSNEHVVPDNRPPKHRLLVVANRLPVSAVRKGDASWQLEVSVGGLVSALLGTSSLFLEFCRDS